MKLARKKITTVAAINRSRYIVLILNLYESAVILLVLNKWRKGYQLLGSVETIFI